MVYESLHNHTVISDGRQTHLEVLETAQNYGFGLIVFTDHDILPRKPDIVALNSYKGPVRWEIGIEVSSGWPKDLGGGAANLFHLLALRIDYKNPSLIDYCQTASQARLERMMRTVSNLKQAGFKIELNRCLEIAGAGAAATPHVVTALTEQEENLKRLDSLAENMKKAAEHDQNTKRLFRAMMYRHKEESYKSYVYHLLLSDQAFLPDIYVPYLYYLDMDSSVDLIRGAGGVAILAHWPTVKHKISQSKLSELLKDRRLDGVEVRTSFTASDDVEENAKRLAKLATNLKKLATIGLDSHDANDFKKFCEIPKLAEQTIGQWQRVLGY